MDKIYSFISELDKMFTSNSVFTEDVSELKLYNRPINIYINNDQANVEAYMEKVNEINELKTKILKKMKFCVADSIFEKINKEEFFKIIDLGKIENSLNVLIENYDDLFHFVQPDEIIINDNHDIILINNEKSFFENLKDFFDIIGDEKQYKDIFNTDHYNDIKGILGEIKYKEDEQIDYSTFINKIQKNLVGIYKKLLLIYFEKYLEGQKNKINNVSSGFLDEIKEKIIENKSVDIELFSFVSKIYAKNKKNLIDESEEDEGEEEDIVENKEIIIF